MAKAAYILRQSPGGVNVMQTLSLPGDYAVNGWSSAPNLRAAPTYDDMRNILKSSYYSADTGFRRAGYAATTMWQFLKAMEVGDYIVVPGTSQDFYVGRVSGDSFFEPTGASSDTSYRRHTEWLNGKKSIPRTLAQARLRSRMKIYQTSAVATDLISEIEDALRDATFPNRLTANTLERYDLDVRDKVVPLLIERLRDGYLDDFAFEKLVQRLLVSYGALEANIIPRSKDKGVDIIATFPIAEGLASTRVAVQVKHHRNHTDRQAIDQLLKGMGEEDYSAGWVISSAEFDNETQDYAQAAVDRDGTNIRLIDGEEIARMILKKGI